MHETALIFTLLTAVACMLASFVLDRRFERHLFAWVSAAYMIKGAFMISGYLDENSERYIQDCFMSLIFISFSIYAMVRVPRCRPF